MYSAYKAWINDLADTLPTWCADDGNPIGGHERTEKEWIKFLEDDTL